MQVIRTSFEKTVVEFFLANLDRHLFIICVCHPFNSTLFEMEVSSCNASHMSKQSALMKVWMYLAYHAENRKDLELWARSVQLSVFSVRVQHGILLQH